MNPFSILYCMFIVAEGLPLEKQFRYFGLLSFVVALLGVLFGTVVLLRWLGRLKPKPDVPKPNKSLSVDPWHESAKRQKDE